MGSNDLSCPLFAAFSKHTTSVQGIVNDLADGRRFWINVHSVARFEMSNDSFRSDFQSKATQFGIASCLDMIDSKQPLI